jgi:bifunctional DNA-binding transcriptional regulator/antitoxin component of YhaV-PrlF toxin-antitoxin module
MKLTNLTNLIMTYTLKLFNTGQVTLPKAWRNKFDTKHFVAEETQDGLLIKPLIKDDTVYYEDKDGFGIYSESGLDTDKISKSIKKLNG